MDSNRTLETGTQFSNTLTVFQEHIDTALTTY